MARTHLLVAAAAVLGALPYVSGATAKPHIITLLIDDLGFYDSQVRGLHPVRSATWRGSALFLSTAVKCSARPCTVLVTHSVRCAAQYPRA